MKIMLPKVVQLPLLLKVSFFTSSSHTYHRCTFEGTNELLNFVRVSNLYKFFSIITLKVFCYIFGSLHNFNIYPVINPELISYPNGTTLFSVHWLIDCSKIQGHFFDSNFTKHNVTHVRIPRAFNANWFS